MSSEADSLWRNPRFIRLWVAQILSQSGSQITQVALPLTAVLVLEATAAQMAMLVVARSLPNLMFGLFAGVWVDRTRRGPILLGADIGRAVLLGSIPLAAMLGYLTFEQVVFVVFGSATLGVFFTIASVSILPSLVLSDQLVEANSKMAVSNSVLGIVGPGVAGGLVQLVSAPKAIVVDAVSYVLSAVSLKGLSSAEAQEKKIPKLERFWHAVWEGIYELVRTPVLKSLTISAGVGSLGGAMQQTVLMLFLVRVLEFTPVEIGMILACVSAGGLFGSAVAAWVAKLFGVGRAIVLGNFLWSLGVLLIPFAGWVTEIAFWVVGVGQVFAGLGASIFSVNQMGLRQQLTPVDRFGRTTAARRFLIFGLAAVGASVAGVLGAWIGLQSMLFLGGVGFLCGFIVVLFSPVRKA